MRSELTKNENFRPGTEIQERKVVFNFIEDGKPSAAMGDMICWMAAIVYIAETYDFVLGHLIVPRYFERLASRLLARYPKWRVFADKIPQTIENGTQLRRPISDPVNATGTHLIDLGFQYFCGINPPPKYDSVYPPLDLDDYELPLDLKLSEIVGKYAIMTPGSSAANRKMPPKVYNEICMYLVSIGITPVHAGDRKMIDRSIEFDERYDLNIGVNLIGKTNLIQLAKIIQDAEMVIGIDNGILHLAALTDTTILQGLTIAGPTQRRIYRLEGQTIEVHAEKKDLACLFCQEHVRFFLEHSFDQCLYKENEPQCVKMLNYETWKNAIDMAVKVNNEAFN